MKPDRRQVASRLSWALGLTLAALAPLAPLAPLATELGSETLDGPAVREPTVVLISLDGTRPADLRADTLPSLLALAERGARAERLIPVFPTNTFPNHVSLVTGVAPERHGIVNNDFIDPVRGRFSKEDIPSWIEVEPIWSILARAGLRSASFYWVGSEGVWPGGSAPADWRPFSSGTPESEKVDQILRWLDRSPPERPRLITSWFRGADHAGHDHGPGSPEVVRELVRQDEAIARLLAGFDQRGLWSSTTLLFVSDHGMALAPERIDLESALREAGIDAWVYGIGGLASVAPRGGDEAIARTVEIARSLGLEAFRREEAPPELRLRNPRFGDVVALASPGSAISHRGLVLEGFHGYRPELPEMAGLLIAAGRGVEPGQKLPAVRALDVAPTVLALLGVDAPSWMEGRAIEGIGVGERRRAASLRPLAARIGRSNWPIDPSGRP